MKIIELKFKNLNSLYDEWVINFTSLEYTSNGIFALTGPTGAGKSTILDAICLALYGATPRLGKITKSNNEIMSKQTGECYSEVTFKSQGKIFKCHWSQHRARKKSTGNLTNSKHEISDVVNGHILESKKRDVAEIIQEKTGMNFDQFTRSILLAQGKFDTFLRATTEQKSKILEQITGTEIYTKISKRVHERQKNESNKLNLLQNDASKIAILSNDQEHKTLGDLSNQQKLEKNTTEKIFQTEKAIKWLTDINKICVEIASLSKKAKHFFTENENFKLERKKLISAQKAAEIEPSFAKLKSIRQQQIYDQDKMKNYKSQLPDKIKLVLENNKFRKTAEKHIIEVRKKYKIVMPLLQKIRTLDLLLVDKKKSIKTLQEDCSETTKKIKKDKVTLEEIRAKLNVFDKDLDFINNYLSINSYDELLIIQFAGIKEQINNFKNFMQDLSEKKEEIKVTKKKVLSSLKIFTSCTNDLFSHNYKYMSTQKQVFSKKIELNNLLKNKPINKWREKKETLLKKIFFLHRSSDFKSERSKLKDGFPCPLCGSRKHLYPKNNIPEIKRIEKKITSIKNLIQKAEQLETKIEELKSIEKNAYIKMLSTEKLLISATNEKENTEKHLEKIIIEISKTNLQITQLETKILSKLRFFNIYNLPQENIPLFLSSLKNRVEKWQSKKEKKEKKDRQIISLKSEMEKLTAVIKNNEHSLNSKQERLYKVKEEYNKQKIDRQNSFDLKNPDTIELDLEKLVLDTEKTEKIARTKYDKSNSLLHSLKILIFSLKENISRRGIELQILEENFKINLHKSGFHNEKSFLRHRLNTLKKNQLLTRAKKIDNAIENIQTQIKDHKNRLTKEIDKKITDLSMEHLKLYYKELKEALTKIRDNIVDTKYILRINNTAKKATDKNQILINAQRIEFCKWAKLHHLIGSADGKKYRNFAQGVTFGIMVAHSNIQLAKMTDRYLLIRDHKYPLELNVIDNYQAGEIRSTKNLSGGESFIVSLSLSLGLSKMSNRKLPVDSLFLDEGFGTLDEEALETALETLATLQQSGKLIGIVSHVLALKNRIKTQINISPICSGKSSITGAGCRKLSNAY